MSPTKPTAEDRRRRRNDDRRRLILDAAAAEFAEHGFESATLTGIGDRVGLSKASLYYYVDSKEDLLVELVEGMRKEVEALSTARAGKNADARVRLRAFVHAHVEVGCTSTEGRLLAANMEFLKTKAATEPRRRYEALLRTIVQSGIDAGEFADVPIGPVVKLMYGALNSIPTWFDPKGSMALDEVIDLFLRVVLLGIDRRAVAGDRSEALKPAARTSPKARTAKSRGA